MNGFAAGNSLCSFTGYGLSDIPCENLGGTYFVFLASKKLVYIYIAAYAFAFAYSRFACCSASGDVSVGIVRSPATF